MITSQLRRPEQRRRQRRALPLPGWPPRCASPLTRLRFPVNDPSLGKIVCEAHNDHFVGLAEGSTPVLNQFDTFQNEDRAATAEAGDKGIIIHFGDSYYGRTNVDGNPVSESEAQEWDVREISMVPL